MRPDRQNRIASASRYTPCDDIAVVTAYFNWEGFRSKRINFDAFARPLREGGCAFQTVECAFGKRPFELPKARDVWRVRARDVLWHKECLLNAVIRGLPSKITKVAWLDADVLFEDASWLVESSRLLDEHLIVQPFEWAIRLPRSRSVFDGQGFRYRSFAAVLADDPLARLTGSYPRHGHTGFAWAARRDLLERHGLFDSCIAGSGDHLIAHGFCGDVNSICVSKVLGVDTPHRHAYSRWAKSLYADAQSRIGHRHGALLHLWHGEMANRRYAERNQELIALGFDPRTDLSLDPQGCCWEWNTDKPELREWARDYFAPRAEGG